jgi:hypothetical protein
VSKVELSTDDIVDAFCRMLEKGVRKDALPREDCNKYGVDVLYNKRDKSLLMFHFVTLDYLEVNLEMDLIELQRRGKEYMEHLYGLLCDQTEKARQQRQEANSITIHTGSSYEKKKAENNPPKIKESVKAHNEVIH